MPLSAAIDVILDFGFPAVALLLVSRFAAIRTLGAGTLCYLGGMIYANLPGVTPHMPVVEPIAFATMSLSIPLLLFSVDVVAWTRLARTAVLAFVLACGAVVVCNLVLGRLFDGNVPYAPELAGMLTGVYIGGTPNMAALAGAFKVPPEVFVNCNAADLVWSAFFMLFMLTIGPRVLARFMRPYPKAVVGSGPSEWQPDRPATIKQRVAGIGLSVACSVVGGAVYALLAPSEFAMAVAILVITTLAVLASMVPRVRTLAGTYTSGQYLLFVFCFSAGSMADIGKLLQTGPAFLLFTLASISSIAVLQFAVMKVFGIDRDTAIVTSVATIMSPAFIAPVADRLENRDVLFTGIASGLMGYAVGNYLGIAVEWVLR